VIRFGLRTSIDTSTVVTSSKEDAMKPNAAALRTFPATELHQALAGRPLRRPFTLAERLQLGAVVAAANASRTRDQKEIVR
jgi:hypothetical protein